MDNVLIILSCRDAITEVWLLLTRAEAEMLCQMIDTPTEILHLECGDQEFSSDNIDFRIIDDLKSIEAFKILSKDTNIWFPLSPVASECDGSEFLWRGFRFRAYKRTDLHNTLVWYALHKLFSDIEINNQIKITYESCTHTGTIITLENRQANHVVKIETAFQYYQGSLHYNLLNEMNITEIRNAIKLFSDLYKFNEEFYENQGYIKEMTCVQEEKKYFFLLQLCKLDDSLKNEIPASLLNMILSYIPVENLLY